jgi:WLM domain
MLWLELWLELWRLEFWLLTKSLTSAADSRGTRQKGWRTSPYYQRSLSQCLLLLTYITPWPAPPSRNNYTTMASVEDSLAALPPTHSHGQPPHADSPDAPMIDSEASDSEEQLTITIHHHGKPIPVVLPASATLTDLSNLIAEQLSIPTSNQKYMITPKVGTLKPPFNTDHALSTLLSRKVVLLGSSTLEVSALSTQIAKLSAPRRPSPIKSARPARHRDWKKVQDGNTYTFHTLRPLPYLPNPERSLRFLERLRDDPGIRAAMRTHKFSVPLLTEMDPAMHTTHESRTLGLNRNGGEVIELRLRTDAYDGYRDYKTIRKTLCHELAHNVFGPHDRNFYDLMAKIEKEVEKADWTRGGRSVGEEEFYNPGDGGYEEADEGGWTGGEFVLGRAQGAEANSGLSRREILARAAEERLKWAKDEKRPGGSGAGAGSSST